MVKIHIPMASSLPIGEPLKLTFCRASECISGEFSLATDANTFRSHGTLTIPEDPSLTLNSDRLDVGVNQHQLQAYANIEITYVPDQQSDLVDGDHYRITITNSYNLKLLDYETTLTYTTYHPNGPQCEPVCRGVEVTL